MADTDQTLEFVPQGREDDEGLFARDLGGVLVRVDAPTESEYEKKVTLKIDGREVTVPMAAPLRDAQGNLVLDLMGRTTPKRTTVFDAAIKLHAGEGNAEGGLADPKKFPIPVLCHQPHMTPVAVCRI